jgi:hypothetical protein
VSSVGSGLVLRRERQLTKVSDVGCQCELASKRSGVGWRQIARGGSHISPVVCARRSSLRQAKSSQFSPLMRWMRKRSPVSHRSGGARAASGGGGVGAFLNVSGSSFTYPDVVLRFPTSTKRPSPSTSSASRTSSYVTPAHGRSAARRARADAISSRQHTCLAQTCASNARMHTVGVAS